MPLPRGRTKRQQREQRSKRTTFRPLEAVEPQKLLDVRRDPRSSGELRYFPLTEFLLLTGLRYGEAAGLRWALARAKVAPRQGDGQKALRRSDATSALVCGRNPKLVAAELATRRAGWR